MSNFISDSEVEKALNFLRDFADDIGRLSGLAKFLDHKRKVIRGQKFLEGRGTVAERAAQAEASDEYQNLLDQHRDAEMDRVTLLTKMKAAELKIEVWRSLNARRGRGHV